MKKPLSIFSLQPRRRSGAWALLLIAGMLANSPFLTVPHWHGEGLHVHVAGGYAHSHDGAPPHQHEAAHSGMTPLPDPVALPPGPVPSVFHGSAKDDAPPCGPEDAPGNETGDGERDEGAYYCAIHAAEELPAVQSPALRTGLAQAVPAAPPSPRDLRWSGGGVIRGPPAFMA